MWKRQAMLFAVAVCGPLFAIMAVWVVWDFFRVLADPHPERTSLRNAGIVVAGLVASGFAVWRGMILEKQTKVARDQYARSLDRDYADLFTKAVEQLGTTREIRSRNEKGEEVYTYEPNIEVRLGAIYALERISQDSERDHIAVMETLCAYVRENAPVEEGTDFEPPEQEEGLEGKALRKWWRETYNRALRAWLEAEASPRADIQAVLTVLGRRSEERVRYEIGKDESNPRYRLDLRKADLRKADMRKGDFRKALFTGARMQGAGLREARMQGAELSQARIQGADLRQAQMKESDLGEARMEGAVLYQARLERADLSQARMQGADLGEARMEGANLRQAQMQGADLQEALMQGTLLQEARMEGAVLYQVRMERAILYQARMQGADLQEARMQGADLGEVRLKSAKLAWVHIDSVEASFADFTDVEDLSQKAVESCFGCAGTVLPDGLQGPLHWHPDELDGLRKQLEAYHAWKAARAAGERPPWVDAGDWVGWPEPSGGD